MCGSVAFCHIPYGTFTCIYNRLVLHYIPQLNCRISTSVVCRLPKPKRRVRFPYPAPRRRGLHIVRDDFYFKNHRSFISSLLLSKPNPHCWASVWFGKSFGWTGRAAEYCSCTWHEQLYRSRRLFCMTIGKLLTTYRNMIKYQRKRFDGAKYDLGAQSERGR